MIKPTKTKFKTYKSDAAPFFFYIDIFPPDTTHYRNPIHAQLINSIRFNPIMPLPMRIDRVFNGEESVLIHPKEAISFQLNDDILASVNPNPFIQSGIEKLIYFSHVRASEDLLLPLDDSNAFKWWHSTRFLYGNLISIEEDFSAFLRAYLYTVVKAYFNKDDLKNAAKSYCEIISDICRKRISENSITIEVKGKFKNVKLYKRKEKTYYKKFEKIDAVQYHPELVDVGIFNLSDRGFIKSNEEKDYILKNLKPKLIQFIPLLFYDDLLECMLQNLDNLEKDDGKLLSPSFLFENNIIVLHDSKTFETIDMDNFSWWQSFDNINIEIILKSMRSTLS